MLSKNALGNLIRRYRSVLNTCHLLNSFGSLAVAAALVAGGASGAFGASAMAVHTLNGSEQTILNNATINVDGTTHNAGISIHGGGNSINGPTLINLNGNDTIGILVLRRGESPNRLTGETTIKSKGSRNYGIVLHSGKLIQDGGSFETNSILSNERENLFTLNNSPRAFIGDVYYENANSQTAVSGLNFILQAKGNTLLTYGDAAGVKQPEYSGQGPMLVLNKSLSLADDQGQLHLLPADGPQHRAMRPLPDLYFCSGSTLAVKAGATLNAGQKELQVEKGAKLLLFGAEGGQDYTVVENFSLTSSPTGSAAGGTSVIEGWNNEDMSLYAGAGLKVTRNADPLADGRVTLHTEQADPAVTMPALAPRNAARAALQGGDTPLKGLLTDPSITPEVLTRDLNSVTQMASAAAVQNNTLLALDMPSRKIAERLSLSSASPDIPDGFAMWGGPMYGHLEADNLPADGFKSGYDDDSYGLILGGDSRFSLGNDKIRLGWSLNAGGSEVKSDGGVNRTENDSSFWGLSLYGNWQGERWNIMADASYVSAENELEQRASFATMKSDVDSDAFTAGLRAEYLFKMPWADILPHVGARYTTLKTDAFDTRYGDITLLNTTSERQDLWQLPVGVMLSHDFAIAENWILRPKLDLSYVPVFGDTDAESTVRFSGVQAEDKLKQQVVDEDYFDGVFGLELQRGKLAAGLNYSLQAGSHTTNHGLSGYVEMKF